MASSSATTPLVDVLSSDYADMTLGNSKNSMRNTGPSLSPKENIKKLKSSFFGCNNKIDEHKMDCASGTIKPIATHAKSMQTTSMVPTSATNSKNAKRDEGDYTIMNPILRNVSSATHHTQQPSSSSSASAFAAATPMANTTPAATKKTALVTIDPDKVMAKTNIDGFKPITSRADKEVFQKNNTSIPTANANTTATTFNRQHSAPVEKPQRKNSSITTANDNGGYELLELRSSSSSHAMMSSCSSGNARITRPNSVNSEKTSFTPLMRPNSANSERQSTSTFSLTSTPLNETGTQSVRRKRCFSLLYFQFFFWMKIL